MPARERDQEDQPTKYRGTNIPSKTFKYLQYLTQNELVTDEKPPNQPHGPSHGQMTQQPHDPTLPGLRTSATVEVAGERLNALGRKNSFDLQQQQHRQPLHVTNSYANNASNPGMLLPDNETSEPPVKSLGVKSMMSRFNNLSSANVPTQSSFFHTQMPQFKHDHAVFNTATLINPSGDQTSSTFQHYHHAQPAFLNASDTGIASSHTDTSSRSALPNESVNTVEVTTNASNASNASHTDESALVIQENNTTKPVEPDSVIQENNAKADEVADHSAVEEVTADAKLEIAETVVASTAETVTAPAVTATTTPPPPPVQDSDSLSLNPSDTSISNNETINVNINLNEKNEQEQEQQGQEKAKNDAGEASPEARPIVTDEKTSGVDENANHDGPEASQQPIETSEF